MEQEREEVYERIPWETLEKKGGDRQWMVYVVAGAVALGALAYSFTRNQPVASPTAEEPTASTTLDTTPTTAAVSEVAPSTVASPVVVAEADLYAVDPERIVDQAKAHAEWVAVEYVSYDGSEESTTALATLLPTGTPTPQAPEGTQVFVDWASSAEVVPTGAVSFDVSVVVRSLHSSDGSGFIRQAPLTVTVPVEVTETGPRATGLPLIATMVPEPAPELSLEAVPEEVLAGLEGTGEVVGGRQMGDGTWEVVMLADGADGVTRPVTVRP
jgi:hypothetical protein